MHICAEVLKPTVSPLTISLVHCPITRCQRSGREGRPWCGGDQRRDERGAPPEAWGGAGGVAPPGGPIGVARLVRGGLRGATPRGQPGRSAGRLPPGHHELHARRLAVLETCRAPALGRHGPRAFWRRVGLDLPSILAATTCHQRRYAERYNRSTGYCTFQVSIWNFA